MPQPNRRGAYNGENVNGYVWSNLTGGWINLSGLSGLGSTLGALSTNPIKIDSNAIIQNIQNSDFGKNMAEISKGIAKMDGKVVGDGGSQSSSITSFNSIQNSGAFQTSEPDGVGMTLDARNQIIGIN